MTTIRSSNIGSLARRHRLLLFVLAAAGLVRLGVAIAYAPGLFWSDSWGYLGAAREHLLYPYKPSGYPLLLRILGWASKDLVFITTVQHLAGLAGGVLVYALLRRLEMRPLVAAAAAAVLLLDGYAIALEQNILTESFFTLACVVWVYAAIGRDRGLPAVGLAGLALGVATTIRTVGLFAIPVWLVYCAWAYRDRRRVLVGLLAVVAPLLCYAAIHQADVGGFRLTDRNGQSLYGRVAQIGNCSGRDVSRDLRPLCPARPAPAAARDDPVDFYNFSPASPAHAVLAQPSADSRMRRFALEVIKARPFAFARLIGHDTLRFFQPGKMSALGKYDDPIELPARPRPLLAGFRPQQMRYAPGYAERVRAPSHVLRSYQRWVHTPRWLMGVMALAGLIEILLSIGPGRTWLPHRREVFLLVGGGLALLVGGASSHFEPRYLVPAVPLLLAGGTLALSDLSARALGHRSRRSARGPTA